MNILKIVFSLFLLIIFQFIHLKVMKTLDFFKIGILLFILTFFIRKEAKAVDIGPFAVTIGFCQNIQKLGSIVNSYTQVQWPTTGYPGITMGLLSNTSVIMDFCNYIIQMEQLDSTQAIFFSANYLNTLTGKKWDDHLQQADKTWNIANSVYDFENGGTRKGALESASTHRELNEYIKDTKQWSSKTFNGKDADVRTRAQRENDMQRLAGAAFRRAITKEMTNCPEPTNNKNYIQLYQEQIAPKEKIRDESQEDYMFYKDKLFTMGPKFMGSETEIEKFIEEIEKIETFGVYYETKDSVVSDTTIKNSKTKKDANQKPVKEKQKITRSVQSFTAKIKDEMFNNFKTKYADRWTTWVQGTIYSNGSYGFLDNAESRVESEFIDLNYECNERKLMQGIDSDKSDYDFQLDKKRAECLASVQMDQKKIENLLNYYITKLQSSLYKFKNANAQIWTIESKELGRSRVISSKNQGDFQQEEVTCSANLTPAEMDKLALKQQSINNEFNEIIARETTKQSIAEESERKQNEEYMKEKSIQKHMIEKKNQELENAGKINSGIIPPKSGLGKKGK